MDGYLLGVLLALILWLWNAIAIVIVVNSRFERNLNRIGQRVSWLSLTPTQMEASDSSRSTLASIGRYLLVVGITFPFIFLSWLNVALAAAMIFYRWRKDSGVPQVVREARWKMRNIDMSFDQLVRELMKISEIDPSDFEEYKSGLVAELEERGLDPRRL